MSPEFLSSIAAVVTATIFVVQIAKGYLGDKKYFKSVPTWVYSVAVAAGLTLLANKVFGTLDGSTMDLVKQAVINAATASGFYEWARHYARPLSHSSGGEPEKLPAE